MYFRQDIFSARYPFGKISFRQDILSARYPFGKMSFRQDVFGIMSFGKMSFGEVGGHDYSFTFSISLLI